MRVYCLWQICSETSLMAVRINRGVELNTQSSNYVTNFFPSMKALDRSAGTGDALLPFEENRRGQPQGKKHSSKSSSRGCCSSFLLRWPSRFERFECES